MSNLDKLIAKLSSNDVKKKFLWEVTIWNKKFSGVDRKKQPKVIKSKCLVVSELFTLEKEGGDVFLLSAGERTGWTTEELAGDYLCEGEIVAIPEGKAKRSVRIKYYKGKFVIANNHIATSADTKILLNKYLYYWLISQNNVIDTFYRGSSNLKHPSMKDLLDMQISIPPLPVQQEIVRILDSFTDSFTELIANLKAELDARKKQYEYYLNKLLTPVEVNGKWLLNGKEIEWKPLGELGKFISCEGLKKSDLTDTGVPAIHYSEIYTYYQTIVKETKSFVSYDTAEKLKKVDTGDVVITEATNVRNFETVCKSIVYLGKVQAVTGNHAIIFKPSNKILGEYFAYFTQTNLFKNEKRKYAKGSIIISVLPTDLSKIVIPVPPVEEQKRIVSILNKFEVLINSITEGLPKEIELRQKQYEYYRDLLFSFPKNDD